MKKFIAPFLVLLLTQLSGFSFSGGTGTSADPYLVSNAADLQEVRTKLSRFFKQTQDIDLTGIAWEPIGTGVNTSTNYFDGVYDGNGYAIKGLNVQTTNKYAGLFGQIGYATEKGTVKNLRIESAMVESTNSTSNSAVGILAGFIVHGEISNCSVSGVVNGYTAGGLVGLFLYGSIKECSSTANVAYNNIGIGTTPTSGGLVGQISGAYTVEIANCFSFGTVSNSHVTGRSGGFVGTNTLDLSSFINCYSANSINANSSDMGGFVGYYSTGSFSNCYFDLETAGTTNTVAPTGITAKTTEEMTGYRLFYDSGWDFKGEALNGTNETWNVGNGRNSGYPYLNWQYPSDPAAFATWTGNESNDWNTSGNWNYGVVPSAFNHVTIPNVSNKAQISTSQGCNDLVIEPDAELKVAPNGTLTVANALINNSNSKGLVLKSDATGTGKLVNNTEGVQATVQQYIVKDQWHYISSPISNLTDVNTVFNKFYLIKNDESKGLSDSWVYLEEGESMVPSKGYGVMWNRTGKPDGAEGYTDQTVSFAGALNTGFVFPTISYSGTDRGWNLVGNPYPCTIDWGSVVKTQIDGAVYVYNPTTNNYSSYVDETQINGGSRYIAPMQGFFVKANDSEAKITFTKEAKTIEPSTFKSASVQNIIRLALSDAQGATDESVIRIHPAATETFDGKLDAYKLKATASATPQLYSVLNGDEYSINSIPEATVNTVIPFELLVKSTGNQQIAATELTGLDATLDVVLEDLQTGARTLLANSAYRFSATAGETRKFNLLFADATNVTRVEARAIKAYGAENRMCISNMSDGRNIVAVYNLNGQLVLQTNAEGSYTEVELPNGLYVVKVTPEDGTVFNGKVMIRPNKK